MPTTLLLEGISPNFDPTDERSEAVVSFTCRGGVTKCSGNKFIQTFNSSASLLQPVSGTVKNFNTAETVLAYTCSKCQKRKTFSFEIRSSPAPVGNNSSQNSEEPIESSFENVITSFSRTYGVELLTGYKCKSCSDLVQFSFNFADIVPQKSSSFINISATLPYKNENGKSVLEAKAGHCCSKCQKFCELGLKFAELQENTGDPDLVIVPQRRKSSTAAIVNNRKPAQKMAAVAKSAVKRAVKTVKTAKKKVMVQSSSEKSRPKRREVEKTVEKPEDQPTSSEHLPQRKPHTVPKKVRRRTSDGWTNAKKRRRSGTACKCSFCPNVLSDQKHKREHERRYHPGELADKLGENALKCPGCSAPFEDRQGLRCHVTHAPMCRQFRNIFDATFADDEQQVTTNDLETEEAK